MNSLIFTITKDKNVLFIPALRLRIILHFEKQVNKI